MYLFIDDLRDPPGDLWTVARTSNEAISILRGIYGSMVGAPGYPQLEDENLEVISFDHDLGGDDTTRPVILWMCEYGLWPREVYCHSMNPIGKKWILGMADQYAPDTTEVIGLWQ